MTIYIWPIGTEIWFRTDKMWGRRDRTRQNYISLTPSGDNKSKWIPSFFHALHKSIVYTRVIKTYLHWRHLSKLCVNLICNMTTFRKKNVTFWSNLGVQGVCKDRICACMVLFFFCSIPLHMTIFIIQKCFDLLTPPQSSRVSVRTEYVLAWCSMLQSH